MESESNIPEVMPTRYQLTYDGLIAWNKNATLCAGPSDDYKLLDHQQFPSGAKHHLENIFTNDRMWIHVEGVIELHWDYTNNRWEPFFP